MSRKSERRAKRLVKAMQATTDVAGPNMILPNTSNVQDAARKDRPGSLVTDHGALSGLTDDDHTQYQKETDFTSGSVIFRGTTVLDEDNTNLFWDNTNNRLGIGTNSPATELEVAGDIRLGFNSKIQVVNTGRDNYIQLYDGGTGGMKFRVGAAIYDYPMIFNQNGADVITIKTKKVGVGTNSPGATLHVSGTDGIIVPVGTTGQRVATQGMIRYNTTTSKFEGYDGAAWQNFH